MGKDWKKTSLLQTQHAVMQGRERMKRSTSNDHKDASVKTQAILLLNYCTSFVFIGYMCLNYEINTNKQLFAVVLPINIISPDLREVEAVAAGGSSTECQIHDIIFFLISKIHIFSEIKNSCIS